MVRLSINKRLLTIKGYFFLFNAGTAPVISFLSLYSKQLGFSSVIVGIIYTVLPISGMISKPIAGAIADRFHCQKAIFLVAGLLVAVGFVSIYFAPGLPLDRKVHFSCDGSPVFDTCIGDNSLESVDLKLDNGTTNCKLQCTLDQPGWNQVCLNWNLTEYCSEPPPSLDFEAHVPLDKADLIGKCAIFPIDNVTIKGSTFKPHCPTKISSICSIDCDNVRTNELVSLPVLDDETVLRTHQFWLFLVLMTFTWVSMAVVVSVGDTICFALLGDRPSAYGNQRCFGALGWGVLVIIAGLIVDNISKGEINKNYLPAFILSVILLIFNFICCYFIEYSQQVYDASILTGIGKLFKNIRVVIFMVWCMYIGLCTGLMWNFYLWLVAERAKDMPDSESWISTLQGLLIATQTLLGELPFFWLSGWILKRIGHIQAMNLVLLVFGIRYILYSVVTNPWYYIPIDICNGFTFGIFYASMASYASIIAPPGTETTIQGLVGAIFEGVGVSFGSLIAGSLFDKYGGPFTFRCFGISSLIVCLLHFFVQLLLKEKNLEKDFSARYATPADALTMLSDDRQELQLIS